jgi:hypothetical protein
VANSTSKPTTLDPAVGPKEPGEMSARTETGLAAREVFKGFTPGLSGAFSLSLRSLDAALHLAAPVGTPATNAR